MARSRASHHMLQHTLLSAWNLFILLGKECTAALLQQHLEPSYSTSTWQDSYSEYVTDLYCAASESKAESLCAACRLIPILSQWCLACCSLLARGLVLGEEDASDKVLQHVSSGLADGTVVHLVVRRTAKVNYSVQGSNFELSISASDTAETVKR